MEKEDYIKLKIKEREKFLNRKKEMQKEYERLIKITKNPLVRIELIQKSQEIVQGIAHIKTKINELKDI